MRMRKNSKGRYGMRGILLGVILVLCGCTSIHVRSEASSPVGKVYPGTRYIINDYKRFGDTDYKGEFGRKDDFILMCFFLPILLPEMALTLGLDTVVLPVDLIAPTPQCNKCEKKR